MTLHFARAMRAATQATQTANLAEATRIIQQALSGGGRGVDHAVPAKNLLPYNPPEPQANASVPPQQIQPVSAAFGDQAGTAARFPSPHLRRSGEATAGIAFRRPAHPPVSMPDGASFITKSFACNSGNRDYKLYIPASAAQKPRGLIVMLHGCTQNPDDFARGTRMNVLAEQHGLLISYPAQHRAANASGCWNWFNPGDQRRDGGEPAILAGIAQEIAAKYGLGREQTFVAGLSAGGAMAAVLAKAYPDVFSAAGVHSGLACGAAHDMVSAFAAMKGGRSTASTRPQNASNATGSKVRTIIFHGSSDKTVHPVNAGQIAEAASYDKTQANWVQMPPRAYNNRMAQVTTLSAGDGTRIAEMWLVEGAGHAWFGGCADGTYTDASGPDASAEMIRFFLEEGQTG